LFLSAGRIEEVAETLLPHYGQDCPAAVVFRATWPDEKVVRGTLDEIATKAREEEISRTAMILVGHALTRPLSRVSRLYDKGFTHGYRQGDSS
jgi:precorrin-4/cobalt-precorrin-4 C11-methyltransferase